MRDILRASRWSRCTACGARVRSFPSLPLPVGHAAASWHPRDVSNDNNGTSATDMRDNTDKENVEEEHVEELMLFVHRSRR